CLFHEFWCCPCTFICEQFFKFKRSFATSKENTHHFNYTEFIKYYSCFLFISISIEFSCFWYWKYGYFCPLIRIFMLEKRSKTGKVLHCRMVFLPIWSTYFSSSRCWDDYIK